jgi:magnesium chelatase family protein
MRQVERAMELGQVSARGASKIPRVAWTIADLAGRDRPGKDEVQTALQLFLGEETA